MSCDQKIEFTKLLVSIAALIGTLAAAWMALKSFRRTEKWKRAEFLAQEMKLFYADPRVQKALLLIDWSTRSIQLLDEKETNHGMVQVTRQLQLGALLPHTIKSSSTSSSTTLATGSGSGGYTTEEAAIRDCYDGFLDGLERFASYVRNDLTHISQLRSYLGYWIDTLHEEPSDAADATWLAALIVYIDFYKFREAQWLFAQLGHGLDPKSALFAKCLVKFEDKNLAAQLQQPVANPPKNDIQVNVKDTSPQ